MYSVPTNSVAAPESISSHTPNFHAPPTDASTIDLNQLTNSGVPVPRASSTCKGTAPIRTPSLKYKNIALSNLLRTKPASIMNLLMLKYHALGAELVPGTALRSFRNFPPATRLTSLSGISINISLSIFSVVWKNAWLKSSANLPHPALSPKTSRIFRRVLLQVGDVFES